MASKSEDSSHATRDFLIVKYGVLNGHKVVCPQYFRRGSSPQRGLEVGHTWDLSLCVHLLLMLARKPDRHDGNTLIKPARIDPRKPRFREAEKPA